MRYFSKYISAALMLILAVACNTKEIDNPDNPDKPQISDNIKIAASIKQTRVSFSVDNNELVPDWEEGDVIFGYYGTGDGRIVFTVTGVDETTGIASLEATSESDWGDFLAEYKTAGKDLKVGLIYTGTKETDKTILFANDNSVSVAMTPQTGENIPACMHATSFVPDEDDEGQIIRFLFDNDCAIFEIESLTGIAEDAGLGENETLKLKSLTVTNLIPTYEYSYASGELSGKSGTVALEPYTINLSNGSWTVDKNGVINHPDNENLLVAVAPNTTLEDILITATATDGMNSREFSYLYNGNLDAGECYMIKKRDVVAKTSDNQYFTSVKAAFDHASTLSSTYEDDNTVTLIKDSIDGLGEQTTKPHGNIIEIDYDVTLDLNDCTLTLADGDEDSDTFEVCGGEFTITDNKNGTGKIEYPESYYAQIVNITDSDSVVNIENGSLTIDGEGATVIYSDNGGTINVTGGNLSAYGYLFEPDDETKSETSVIGISNGDVNITAGTLSATGDADVINFAASNSTAPLTISGGDLSSELGNVIKCRGGHAYVINGNLQSSSTVILFTLRGHGDLTIGDEDCSSSDPYSPYITNDPTGTAPAIYFEDESGDFTMYNGYITGVSGGVYLGTNTYGHFYGGTIDAYNINYSGGKIFHAIEHHGLSLDITGGRIYANDTGSAIYSDNGTVTISDDAYIDVYEELNFYPAVHITGGTLKMNGGEVSSPNYAIRLENKVTGTITGGYISSGSEVLALQSGPECTITGGIIAGIGESGTIRVEDVKNAGTKLSIGWPEGEDVDDKPDGPIIYCNRDDSLYPIMLMNSKNTAKVYISGGYFYKVPSADTGLNAFYYDERGSAKDTETARTNLKECRNFYSNVSIIRYNGSQYNVLDTNPTSEYYKNEHGIQAYQLTGTDAPILDLDEDTTLTFGYKILSTSWYEQ